MSPLEAGATLGQTGGELNNPCLIRYVRAASWHARVLFRLGIAHTLVVDM